MNNTVLEQSKAILESQTAKGSAKYGGPLDVTKPSLVATLRHAQQEAADLLQYLVHAEREAQPDPLTAAKSALDSAIAEVAQAGALAAPAESEWEEFRGDGKRWTLVGDLVRCREETKEAWTVVKRSGPSLLGYDYRRRVSPAPAQWQEFVGKEGVNVSALRQRAETAEADLAVANAAFESRRRDLQECNGSLHGRLRNVRHELATAEARVAELEADVAERDATISRIHEADHRATERWQAATGKTLFWPDRSDLVVWLLEQWDAAKQAHAVAVDFCSGIHDLCTREDGEDPFGQPQSRVARFEPLDDTGTQAGWQLCRDQSGTLLGELLAALASAKEDGARLDWLDQNTLMRFGWHVSKAPAGNIAIHSVVCVGGAVAPIRAAIDAARQSTRNAGGAQ